jgi:UDP-N-acetyl-D-mannosaminuronic acid dehydrogenase
MSTAMTWKETDVDTAEKRNEYTVSVIGCGRTGISTIYLFANAKFRVIGVDSDPYIINLLKRGKIPSGDPKIAEQIKKNVKEGRIMATNQTKEAASTSDIIIFTVPLTLDQKKKPDYSNLENACKEVGMGLRSGSLIIVENRITPGITEILVKEILEKSSGLKAGTDFGLAYITISSSWQPTLQDNITQPKVVGALNEQSLRTTCLVLRQIVNTEIIKVTNIETAETINLFENAYLDVNNALATELGLFCEKVSIDFFEIERAISKRNSYQMPVPNILSGYFLTGSYLLFEKAENVNAKLRLASVARKINSGMLNHTLHLTKDGLRSCGKTMRRANISILGVSSRPELTEINQPFVKHLLAALVKRGARVHIYDPLFSQKKLIELDYPAEKTLRKSIKGADCLIFTVGHDRFKRLNLNRIKFLVRKPTAIVDLANVFNPNEAITKGFIYRGLGRGKGFLT